MVGDQATALEIARTYLSAIYGAEEIAAEMPLKASIREGVWRVEGVFKPGFKGGVAEIKICQSTGQVLSVHHGNSPELEVLPPLADLSARQETLDDVTSKSTRDGVYPPRHVGVSIKGGHDKLTFGYWIKGD